MKNIAVIGGGAAGIMAAITAARKGAKVTILEHKDRVGKKILMTGNGKCNLTNLSFSNLDYYSDEPEFCNQIFAQFSNQDTIAFFKEIGLLWKVKNNGVYPITEQASTVLDVLRMELAKSDVQVITEINIRKICKREVFLITTSKGEFSFDAIILACGGKANAQTGSDGSGYALAEQFGHHIIKPLPALVQLKCRENYYKAIAGVRCEAALSLYVENKLAASESGELQVTEYGISGIAVFQFSRLAAKALDIHKEVSVMIDFLPGLKLEELEEFVIALSKANPMKTVEEILTGVIHKKLLLMIMKQKGLKATELIAKIPNKKLLELLACMKNWTVSVKDTNPFSNAQVCSGGIDCAEIGAHCNSLKVNGLFFAGEIMDVDGKCGGYNLQWAWSSGYVAGKSAV